MKKPKVSKVRTAFVVQFFIIALLIVSFAYVYGQSGNTFIISEGVYPSAPTYTVWREGSTYYAKNEYGAISYSGSSALTVGQNALDQITNGGSIFFKSAIYELSGNYLIPSNVKFYGEGYGTIFRGTTAIGWALILNKDYTTENQGIILSDFKIEQYTSNVTQLILFGGAKNTTVRNIFGVSINKTILRFDRGDNNIIQNNIFYGGGMGLGYASNNTLISNNIIKYVQFGHAIGISGGAGSSIRNIISNNWIYNVSSGLGITIDGISYQNKVIGNYVENTQGDAINLEQWGGIGAPNNNSIIGNTVYNCRISITGCNYSTPALYNILNDNTIYYSSADSVYIVFANYTVLSGNLIYDSGANGLYISNSTKTTIVGGIYESGLVSGWGIRILPSSEHTILIGLICEGGVSAGGIQDLGTNTRINLCYNGTVWLP